MILTTIDGIPLWSTIGEAKSYAAQNGLSGYHIHEYNGKTGYMGGGTHGLATGSDTFNPSSYEAPLDDVEENTSTNNNNGTSAVIY